MIYFVRHGQTEWNKDGKMQGQVETDLNQVGIAQAVEAGKQLSKIKFDICFCSPLRRAIDTCKAVYKGHIVIDNRIIERSFGSFEGKKMSDYNFTYADFWQVDKKPKEMENDESIESVKKRAFDFLDEITEKYQNKNVLIVSHGGFGLLLKSYFYGEPKSGNYTEYFTKNGEIAEFKN